jgi:Protein of unknown function (DUF3572)
MKNRGRETPSTSALRETAEQFAVAALGFLAAEPDRLSRFLSLSGLGPENLRAAAADPAFLSSVLDYLLTDEPLLLAFAADQGQAPESIAAARRVLGGPPPEPP